MKIFELRFKNLNSLYGEWIIDFTDPVYVSNGIFALTGPTGAGKSTVLDAVCLALYGATPRLGKITRSGNEIMSRQTGECYAEVLFESQTGRFRCHWEQRRARKRADGKLQDQEHQIVDADTGKPIETKKSLVTRVIEEKTGMDFDRFTRSILLAQGGFDTFLRADIEQKSSILEQITGTEIYSKISQRVHERQRDEREKLVQMNAKISGIVILEPEQEKEIQQELYARRRQENELTSKSIETGKAIMWLTTVEGLKKEISELSEESVKLQGEIEAFKPERDKLERAVNASKLDGIYAALTALRDQQKNDQTALKNKENILPDLKTYVNTRAESLKSAELQTSKVKEDLKSAAPLIQKIRSIDQTLVEQEKAVLDGSKRCTKKAAKIDTDKHTWMKEQKKRTKTEKILATVEEYLQKHSQDEWLLSGLTGIEEQFGNLLTRQNEITQKEIDLKNANAILAQAVKNLDNTTKQRIIHEQKLEETINRLQQSRDYLSRLLGDRLLREYRNEKEILLREMAYVRKIKELEDHRDKLEDGKPCPLCGSKEHPFARGNVPVPDEIEQKIESLTGFIIKAEDQETTIKKLEKAEACDHKNLNESEKLETNATNEKKVAEKTLAELKDNLDTLRTGFDGLRQVISKKLQPLDITEIPESNVLLLLESLKSRLKSWQEHVRKKTRIEKQIADIESEIKRLDAVIETQSTALTEMQENLERLKNEHSSAMDERNKMYGDKKPDNEESRLNKAIAEAEEAEKKARSMNTRLQQKLTAAETHVESLKKRIEQREPDLIKIERDFSEALEPVGFSDEKQFLEARMTNEERQVLSSRTKEMDNAQTELMARQKDRNTRLTKETARKVTDKNLEELEPQLKEYEESLKTLRDTIFGLKHRLNENTSARERIKEKKVAIEAQKKECFRWEKLHGLIGSADGKKYRNFAQGLTFELMVSHANLQLEKITDRYLLIRDEEQPLELNVVDNYQAGEIRSTKNLSGGECFIVSLTLALGLSSMASRNVRVDSLFLDEGFGTLDEEALETALETLSGLRQEGKLIGVISHISALKERISTQITITPVSGGRSSLVGPGCNRVDHFDGVYRQTFLKYE